MEDLDSHSENSENDTQDLNSEEDETIYRDQALLEEQQTNQKEDLDATFEEEALVQKIRKELQLIYIAKYSQDYRQSLEQIAYSYGCDLSFGKNSFSISCKDKTNLNRWTLCKQVIVQEFDKIIYKKIEDKDKRYRLLYSPQVNRYASEKGIYFSQFNAEIYLHSNRYSSKELEEKKVEICRYCNIFTVCFNKKKHNNPIDTYISKFYRSVLQDYYKDRFEKKNIIIEVNRLERSFYILGKQGATPKIMMDAKQTMKNLIEGITIVGFKNVELDLKAEIKLNDYLKKVSTFPITYGKLSETIVVLISKDNILKELLKKTEKIMQKLAFREDTAIGVYMPFCYSREDKREQVYKICKEMGFDFWSSWGIRYFRPMIASEDDVKNPTQVLELIIQIINGFIEVKEKHEVMKVKDEPEKKINAQKKKQLEEQNKYAYIERNCPKDSVELSKILRRDVIEDEVLMMKRYNVIYSLMEGKEIGPYYVDQKQYDKGVDKGDIKIIEQQNLKKGNFFEVFFKFSNETEEEKTILELEEMLKEEMRRLKKAAKEDKQEGRSLDSERKIAHMIKKVLNVL